MLRGVVSKLVYDNRGKTMEMIETVDRFAFPEAMDATYRARGVVNTCKNRFEDMGDGTTRWTMDTEFMYSGR